MADLIGSELLHRKNEISFEVEDSKLHNTSPNDIAIKEISFDIKEMKSDNCLMSNKESDVPRYVIK